MDGTADILAIAGALLLLFVYGAFRSGALTPDPADLLDRRGSRPRIAANLGYAAIGLAVAAPFFYFYA